MYSPILRELSNSFIKNENLVLPILLEKNFEQKIYFCLSKMRSILFFDLTWTEIFSISCKKFKIFLFILFEKRLLAQGIRRPKVADSFLTTWLIIIRNRYYIR